MGDSDATAFGFEAPEGVGGDDDRLIWLALAFVTSALSAVVPATSTLVMWCLANWWGLDRARHRQFTTGGHLLLFMMLFGPVLVFGWLLVSRGCIRGAIWSVVGVIVLFAAAWAGLFLEELLAMALGVSR